MKLPRSRLATATAAVGMTGRIAESRIRTGPPRARNHPILTPQQEAVWKEEQSKKEKRTGHEIDESGKKVRRVYSEEYTQVARDICSVWLDELEARGDYLLEGATNPKYNICRDFDAARRKMLEGLGGGVTRLLLGQETGDRIQESRGLQLGTEVEPGDDPDIIKAEYTVHEDVVDEDIDDGDHQEFREAA